MRGKTGRAQERGPARWALHVAVLHGAVWLIVALLAAPAAVVSAQELKVAMSAQPEVLDPHRTSATSSFQVTRSLYDTLVEVDRRGEIVPALAESWSTDAAGLRWTFRLREGVRFHDGTLLDSGDVQASIARVAGPGSPKAEEFGAVEGIDTPDARTVVIRLNAPAPALLASLASEWGAVLPEEAIRAGHDFANEPVGTGPFRLETWVRDSYLRLVPFDGHFRGTPDLDGVTLRFVSESALQVQGLLRGDFDIIDAVPVADLPRLVSNPAVRVVEEPSGLVLVAGLNTRRPYLSDVRVRQGLNLAVDKETILEVAYGGGTPVGTFMEAGSPWYPQDVEPYPYDPERARALLSEAGVPSGWTLDLVLPETYRAHVTAGQMIQEMLGRVGVQSRIRLVEWGVWLSTVFGGPRDFDVTVIGHTGKLDPTGRLRGYGEGVRTYVGYENPQVAGWLAEAARTTDQDRRRALYADVLRALHANAPFIYLGTPYRRHATRANVDGFWITPLLDTFVFRDVRVRP
ncbi:ABC transporter substrate-binding protein [Limnochorda pilosa]|uniref:Solute-binding protein family 5 domain-containing protein n=1 Tax=Limnochorda pilosa TaxID=1555112 RepID=A0A0K2SN05_LIMPI|nr:ABC transporter substrate-binding protein [Limnochorda pilosa]BAS28189.1 hypothetical protein LIP_2348 [Limnochorda pilosa]